MYIDIFLGYVLLHIWECTPVMEYDNADDFSSVFIAKQSESYCDIHFQLDSP